MFKGEKLKKRQFAIMEEKSIFYKRLPQLPHQKSGGNHTFLIRFGEAQRGECVQNP